MYLAAFTYVKFLKRQVHSRFNAQWPQILATRPFVQYCGDWPVMGAWVVTHFMGLSELLL